MDIWLIAQFGLLMLGLLVLVYVIAVLTPKIAKKVDALRKSPERVDKDVNSDPYYFKEDGLKSIYEISSKEDDIDEKVDENNLPT